MASGPITSWEIDGETVETVSDFIFLGSKITADSDCSHEIKRCLLLGRKVMTNLDSILKSRELLCQQRSILSRLWFFQWSCMDVRVGLWRKLSTKKLMLSNCGIGEDSWGSLGLQGDPTSPSQRGSVLGVHWKDWRWSWNSNTLDTWKDPGRDWGQEEKGTTEDEMAGWHHWLDGHEFEWILGVGGGQGGLACCDSWGRKESDMTEWLNWTGVCSAWNVEGWWWLLQRKYEMLLF